MNRHHANMLSSGLAVAAASLWLACGLSVAGCDAGQAAPPAAEESQAAAAEEDAEKKADAQSKDEASAKDQSKAEEATSADDGATAKEDAEHPKDADAQDSESVAGDAQEAEKAVDPARVKALEAALQGAVDNAPMTVYTTVTDLTDGTSASVGGDQQIASASMIKVLIAHTFLEQVKAGTVSLDDTYTLQASDLVGGTGTLSGLGAGASVSYRDIFMRMIDVSDNTGTNILIDTVGMDAVNATAKKLGLKCTELNRRMMDYDAIAQGIENYTCADDLAKLFEMAYQGTFVDKESSELMLQALRQQTDRCGIVNGLPEGSTFAHKTGTLATVRHDGGIVEGDHPFVIVVLCGGEGFWEAGAEASMAEVSQAAYGALVQ